jgi:hypothetical protein
VGPRSKGYVRKALRDRQQHLLLCLTRSWMQSFHNRSSTEFYVKRRTPVIVDDRAFRQKVQILHRLYHTAIPIDVHDLDKVALRVVVVEGSETSPPAAARPSFTKQSIVGVKPDRAVARRRVTRVACNTRITSATSCVHALAEWTMIATSRSDSRLHFVVERLDHHQRARIAPLGREMRRCRGARQCRGEKHRLKEPPSGRPPRRMSSSGKVHISAILAKC